MEKSTKSNVQITQEYTMTYAIPLPPAEENRRPLPGACPSKRRSSLHIPTSTISAREELRVSARHGGG